MSLKFLPNDNILDKNKFKGLTDDNVVQMAISVFGRGKNTLYGKVENSFYQHFLTWFLKAVFLRLHEYSF